MILCDESQFNLNIEGFLSIENVIQSKCALLNEKNWVENR